MFRVVRDWVGLASGQFTASDGNRQVPCQSIAVMIIGPISCRGYPSTWWRHQMETFSALLAICAGNSPVTGEFPAQRPVTQSFFFICAWMNGWVHNREADDLRRHRSRYDVTIMNPMPHVYCNYKHEDYYFSTVSYSRVRSFAICLSLSFLLSLYSALYFRF